MSRLSGLRGEFLALPALVLGGCAIGFAPIGVRLAEGLGPIAVGAWRLALALPLLWLWSRLAPPPPAQRPSHWWPVAAGLCFAADLALWHTSLRMTSVADSTLLTNLAPVVVTIGAVLLLGERPTWRFAGGLVLALAGAALLISGAAGHSERHLLGDLLALAAACCYAGYLLIIARVGRAWGVPGTLLWAGLPGAAALFAIAGATGEAVLPSSASDWGVVAGLALVVHVLGQGLITFGFARLPASFGSVVLLVQPVVAAGVAWPLFGEAVTPVQWLGGAVVLLGIVLCRGAVRPAPADPLPRPSAA